MFPQISVSASTLKIPNIPDVQRPIANFHPSIWKDHFLFLSFDALKVDDEVKVQAEQLKQEVKKMLVAVVGNPLEKLRLVDSIQRLGVSYHFENEIAQILEQIYSASVNFSSNDNIEDLDTLALLFRLLRQQDIFKKFVETDRKFKESLASNARGILSLYEAAHMRMHGEDVLEKALDFTVKHLKNFVATSSYPFVDEVSNALKWPRRKSLPRVKAREYMLIYQEDSSYRDTLLTFSKLDFNMLQKLHQKELSEITRWWKDLDFTTNLPFVRDRLVESYFWILGIYYEPQFYVARRIMTKAFTMISILDDLYDAYGTFDELNLLTHAIERWDISMIDQLPEYMKVFYKALLDVYEESEKEVCKNKRSYCIHFAREAMKKQARFHLAEAEWLHRGHKPTLEEYLEVALETAGGSFCTTTSFIGLGEVVTMETFEWVDKNPKILRATEVLARLMDDMASHEFEKERQHIVSAVDCHMEKYGCSKDETCVELHKQVEDAWKEINEACLNRTEIPMLLLQLILNFSRVVHLLYSDEDGYTHSSGLTKFYVQSLLIDSIPI